MLRRTPGLTAAAVLSLALGVMAATAMYSVIHGVVLDPFPYKNVDDLMSVRVRNLAGRGGRLYYSTDQFLEIAGRSRIFDGVIASTISDVLWSGDGEPRRLRGNYGTPNTFEVMGVPALLGRTFTPADTEPVAVLGYRFWQRQFAGDRGIVGRRMLLNGQMRTVVGVMPKRFMWRGADVYLPLTLHRGQVAEGVRNVHLLGRRKPGITDAQAEADLTPIIEELKRRQPGEFPEKWNVGLLSFKETFPSNLREALWILFGAVGLLLLIACANVSNLLLSKAVSRQREMAVRAALGAERRRLIRQLLTESLVLAAMGGGLGVLLAMGALNALIAMVPAGTIPDESEIVINLPVLWFSLALSALTTVLFGLAPALHTAAGGLANPLKEAGRGSSGGVRQTWLRNSLVVGEVALSLMLLAGASLMIRTLYKMQNVDLGFRTSRLLTLRIPFSESRYPDAARRTVFFQELERRVAALPGVSAAGVNVGLHPFGGYRAPVEVAGGVRDDRPVIIHQINSGYLKALGIPLLEGRLFSESESAAKQQVALVNQAFVRRYGRGIVRVPRTRLAPMTLRDDAFQIIGVVRDTVNSDLVNEVAPEMYIPFTVSGMADRLVVLTSGAPMALAAAVRAQVYAIDKDQPVTEERTLESMLDEYVFAERRFNLVLFSVFAGLGLALAAIGVYGVMANGVERQTQEIGVRIALGAGAGDIVGMVLRRGLRLVLLGIAIGLAGGFSSARLLARQIWSVSPFDPISFAAVSLALLVVGASACLWPARRAARVDPMTALRYE